MPKRLLSVLSLSILAVYGSGSAWALGLGRGPQSATLGAALDFSVPLSIDGSDPFVAECVSSEVFVGDTPLSRNLVHAAIVNNGGASSVRVRTTVAIEEPVLTVQITAGCHSKVTRRYTLFADPPGTPQGPGTVTALADLDKVDPAGLALPAVQSGRESAAKSPAKLATKSTAHSTVQSTETSQLRKRRAAPRMVAAPAESAQGTQNTSALAPRSPSAAARSAMRQGTAAAATLKAKTNSSGKALKLGRQASSGGASAASARLRLDAPSVTVSSDQAAALFAEQREAAWRAMRLASGISEAASSAASARVAALESNLVEIKREAAAQRAAVTELKKSLAEADQRGLWAPYLGAAVLGLGGLAAWFYARSRRSRSGRAAAWWTSPDHLAAAPAPAASAAPAEGANAGAATSSKAAILPKPATASTSAAGAHAAAKPVAAAPAPQRELDAVGQTSRPFVNSRTSAALSNTSAGKWQEPTGAVSIEELLDVEQQAEFFVVLGQDDAAVEMLVAHLRSTGGTSPLPYLKLLEIYHRRGDKPAYERTRQRFNERFNAVAPEWAQGLQAGQTLDDYPEVMGNIQSHWQQPVQAMADLQQLLFRADGKQLFDLPAYRDIIFLFTLARELEDMGPDSAQEVDVLLPLGADFGGMDGGPGHDDSGPGLATELAALAEMGSESPDGIEPDLELDLLLQTTAPLDGHQTTVLQPTQPFLAPTAAPTTAPAASPHHSALDEPLDFELTDELPSLPVAQPVKASPARSPAIDAEELSLELPSIEPAGGFLTLKFAGDKA